VVTKKDKHLAAAQKYLERGSFEKALAEFQNAVKEDPKDTRTWLRMAEIYVRLGHNDKATEVYQKTVDLYVEQGFFQRAVAVYKNIIKLSPEFVDARIKLAEVFRQLGLLSDAVQQLEQAATLYQKTNRQAEALSAYKQIIDLNPEQPNPRIRYAELACQAGAIKEAVAEFAEAARLVKAQGRTEEFLRVAERLLALRAGQPCHGHGSGGQVPGSQQRARRAFQA
jgi:pilus assembly protein FimV